MDGARSALIVAADDYTDPGLRQLRAPATDAQALAAVLHDPRIGGFQVRTLLNQPAHEVNLAVEEFFADRRPDDLLLVHFSCHGVKDEGGELYFAAANTRLRRLGATAVAAEFVNRRMNRSRSRRVVLLLDCCYAGAFGRGITARAGTGVGIEEQFGGRGRAVITASSAMEYAFEGGQLTDTQQQQPDTQQQQPSVFTSALVEGLETGEADRDQDGLVALDELYDYVYDRVRAVTPNQTPGKWTFGVQGELVIARRARPVTTPSPLPPELQQAVDHPLAAVRAAAVQELARVSRGGHAGLALAGRLALERLTDDDSRKVSAAAGAALRDQAEPIPPEPSPPDPGPTLPQSEAVPREPQPVPAEPEPARSEPQPAPPALALSATTVQFGRVPQHGRSPERRIRLGNAGGGLLNARASTEAAWLKLRQVGDELVVSVDTRVLGEHAGGVTVDSDGGSALIHVTAIVEPHPAATPSPPAATAGQPPSAARTAPGREQQRPSRPPFPEDPTRSRTRPPQSAPPAIGGDSGGARAGDKPAPAKRRERTTSGGLDRRRTSLVGDRGRMWVWATAVVVAIVGIGLLAGTTSRPLGGLLVVTALALGAAGAAKVRPVGAPGDKQAQARDERRRLLQHHCRFLDDRTAELSLVSHRGDPLELGVRKVPLTAPTADPSGIPRDWPLYVRRDVDEQLDQALRGGGIVLVVGEAHTGKTRTAFEAMHRVCRDRRLLVPKRQASLRVMADAGLTFPHTVVWLDNLDGYLGVNGIDQALNDLACRHADSVVLATMRSGEDTRHSDESASRTPDARQGSGKAVPGLFPSSNRLLGDMATVIPLSPHWSQDERRRAQDQAKDPRIAKALEQPDTPGLVAYMMSGPQLWEKWRDAQLGVQPVGAAAVAAAVDCRRIGYSRPVPVDLLRRMHEAYLENQAALRVPGAFEDGLSWARQGYALLRQVDDGAGGRAYVASGYLVDCVQRSPDAYPVPESTWRLVVERLEPDEAWEVGAAAYRTGLPRFAEQAFRAGTRASREDVRGKAAYGLANVLLDQDEAVEAEKWLRVAAGAGTPGAATNLGWLLERRGDRQQAESHYREAYRQGDVDAANNLGVLFAESGNDRAAEDWLSKAHQAGHPKATNNLGLLLLRRGDRDGASRLFSEAAALGDTEAEEHLRALRGK